MEAQAVLMRMWRSHLEDMSVATGGVVAAGLEVRMSVSAELSLARNLG